mmetsp:Transcript_14583/g.33746  ORF Transcript_14583/g.33746 Transcript_14583/m.33746 type:complete len:87 (+) Transcript_14583:1-261(+)
MIATCYGGRNRKCAEAFAKEGKTWEQLEDELLGGQKLQGPSTCISLHAAMTARGLTGDFPLFETIYAISTGARPASDIVDQAHTYY